MSLLVWAMLPGSPSLADDGFAMALAAAQAGDAEAQYVLARLYERGDGVQADDFESVRWLQRAAAQDHPGAMMDLGWMLANGYGTPKDPEGAYSWFVRAAALEVAGAADQRDALGRTLPGERRAVLTREALKDLPFESSQPQLAALSPATLPPATLPPVTLGPEDTVATLRPLLTGENSIEAFQKLGLLAENGDVLARNLYGLALRRSTDTEDRARGRYWLLLAARSGLPAAQYNFAGALLEDGAPPDFDAITNWLDLATQGSRPADPNDYAAIAREFAARGSMTDPYRAALEGSEGAFPELRQLITMRRQEAIARREMERFRSPSATGLGGITTTVIE